MPRASDFWYGTTAEQIAQFRREIPEVFHRLDVDLERLIAAHERNGLELGSAMQELIGVARRDSDALGTVVGELTDIRQILTVGFVKLAEQTHDIMGSLRSIERATLRPRHVAAEEWLHDAAWGLANGFIEAAERQYRRAIELSEYNYFAHAGLAEVLRRKDQFRDAARSYEMAARYAAPVRPGAAVAAAFAAEALWRHDDAVTGTEKGLHATVALLSEIADRVPTCPELLVHLAVARRNDVDSLAVAFREDAGWVVAAELIRTTTGLAINHIINQAAVVAIKERWESEVSSLRQNWERLARKGARLGLTLPVLSTPRRVEPQSPPERLLWLAEMQGALVAGVRQLGIASRGYSQVDTSSSRPDVVKRPGPPPTPPNTPRPRRLRTLLAWSGVAYVVILVLAFSHPVTGLLAWFVLPGVWLGALLRWNEDTLGPRRVRWDRAESRKEWLKYDEESLRHREQKERYNRTHARNEAALARWEAERRQLEQRWAVARDIEAETTQLLNRVSRPSVLKVESVALVGSEAIE